MELAPEFVDVAVKRWENFTHRVAVRVARLSAGKTSCSAARV
jgi:hypothetical protein